MSRINCWRFINRFDASRIASRRRSRLANAVAISSALGTRGLPLHDFLDQVEREAIQKALEATRFNKTAAAKLLGITFRSLRYRLDRLGID